MAGVDEHLMALPGGGNWNLWRWALLRGAGFPANEVLEISNTETTPAIDRWLGSEEINPPPAISEAFTSESRKIRNTIRGIARQAPFREAIVWQNRRALHTGVDVLLRQPIEARDCQTRKKELLVAAYLQRYCAKSDTIGFFGPAAWFRWAESGPAVRLRPGRSLVSKRAVHFEYWAIDSLGSKLSEDPALKPWMAPRPLPMVWAEETTLHLPAGATQDLPPSYARLLKACDGQTPAKAIAQRLLADSSLELSDEEHVYRMLEELSASKIIVWALEVPPGPLDPETRLREILGRVEDVKARCRALEALEVLHARRETVARAAGDPHRLDAALGDLEATFSRVTGMDGARCKGRSYAGRSLVYEDCLRDVELEMGPDILTGIGPALSLVLLSARWYTFTVASRYTALFREIYGQLKGRTGSGAVDYPSFWERVRPHLPLLGEGKGRPVVEGALRELQEHWQGLLGVTPEARRLEREASSLMKAARALFAAPCPGWPEARYHSPDILIAAPGVEGIRRGQYLAVLGEIHPSVNTLLNPVTMSLHPNPKELVQARESDLYPLLSTLASKDCRGTRAFPTSGSPRDMDIELGPALSWLSRNHVLAAGAFVVEEANGRLEVRARNTQLRFDLVEFLQTQLRDAVMTCFTLFSPRSHLPRVTLDRLVVCRETWRFNPRDLLFASFKTPLDRFVGARRWAKAYGLPRFLFARIPEEVKPVYVDLKSSLYVEILAKLVRRASWVSLTEMLPAIEECWLMDSAGRTYVSELRLVAVDPEPWLPAETALRL